MSLAPQEAQLPAGERGEEGHFNDSYSAILTDKLTVRAGDGGVYLHRRSSRLQRLGFCWMTS
jgi:hypothetical protein